VSPKEASSPSHADENPIETIACWIRYFGEAFQVRLNPDPGVCFRIFSKMVQHEKKLDDLEKIFQDLYAKKQKPGGMGWIISVISDRLAEKDAPRVPESPRQKISRPLRLEAPVVVPPGCVLVRGRVVCGTCIDSGTHIVEGRYARCSCDAGAAYDDWAGLIGMTREQVESEIRGSIE
jgi:hypothetical protein